MTYRELRRHIESHRGEIVALLTALVRIPTENPPGLRLEECANLLEDRLSANGLNVKRLRGPTPVGAESEPRWCLIGSSGEGPQTIAFHGHYDVVPAIDREQFQPVVTDGRLFGRGSADMKSGLVAMLYAVKAMRECGGLPRGRVCIVLVPDEETGGSAGSSFLLQSGQLPKNLVGMLTPEPTGGVVWNASRGALSLTVTIRGQCAHVGLQDDGVNAFEQALDVLDALRSVKEDVEKQKTSFPVNSPGSRNSILMLGGQVRGGANFNVVPDTFSFTIDRRFNPEEKLAAAAERLHEVFRHFRNQGLKIEVDTLQAADSSSSRETGHFIDALKKSVLEVKGREPSVEMCPGLLETRFYARAGVPAYAYGPGLLELAHGPNESVSIDETLACALIYAQTAVSVLSES